LVVSIRTALGNQKLRNAPEGERSKRTCGQSPHSWLRIGWGMSGSVDGLPSMLVPPVAVALAKPVKVLPSSASVPGVMCFEPKWDGYRLLIFRGDTRTGLWSRRGKDLTRYSVGVKRRRADLWPSESAVISARQVSLTCLKG